MIDILLAMGITLAILYLSARLIIDKVNHKDKNRFKDQHIEWVNGEVCLKKKDYYQGEDDLRFTVGEVKYNKEDKA